MKNIYSLPDVHLGSLTIEHRRTHERRLVRFLDSIKHKVVAVYLLDDVFDLWNKYKYVVSKDLIRFFGKISELMDMGAEVHFFIGNYDLWTYGYLERECGVILHRKPMTTEIYNKVFHLAHGDGLDDSDPMFRFLCKAFYNRFCQRLPNFLHPWWGMQLGLNWVKRSRLKRKDGKEVPYLGEDKEYLVQYTEEHMSTHKDIDYYIYGHQHIEFDLILSWKARLLILGDWIWQFAYTVFDGEHIFLKEHAEGESKL